MRQSSHIQAAIMAMTVAFTDESSAERRDTVIDVHALSFRPEHELRVQLVRSVLAPSESFDTVSVVQDDNILCHFCGTRLLNASQELPGHGEVIFRFSARTWRLVLATNLMMLALVSTRSVIFRCWHVTLLFTSMRLGKQPRAWPAMNVSLEECWPEIFQKFCVRYLWNFLLANQSKNKCFGTRQTQTANLSMISNPVSSQVFRYYNIIRYTQHCDFLNLAAHATGISRKILKFQIKFKKYISDAHCCAYFKTALRSLPPFLKIAMAKKPSQSHVQY